MSGLERAGRVGIVLGVGLGLLNLAVYFAVPTIRDFVDARAGRLSLPYRPRISYSGAEIYVYFDPWIADSVFPAVYTLGFAAVAFLVRPKRDDTGSVRGLVAAVCVWLVLLGLEVVWLGQTAVGIFMRGPN